MRFGITQLFAVLLTLHAPNEDLRNTYIPDTHSHFTMPVYRNLDEWNARKERLRKQVLSAAGLLPMPPRTPLNPRVWGRLNRDKYSISKVLLETLPGYYLGGNLYEPAHATDRHPGILLAHGHWRYGRLQHDAEYSVPALAINLARQGYVVFAYDMVGYNDTRQTPHSFGGESEQLWGFTPLGLQLWNSVRALDFLAARDNVDANRLGMTGASGGGTQTFLLSAIDERIRFSAPVNMISGVMQGGDPCEDAPSLRLGTFNAEIAALMAPRGMLIVSSTRDWTRNTPLEEYPEIRSIYDLYGARDKVSHVQFDAPHNYNRASREAVYRFFGQNLLKLDDVSKLKDIGIEQERDEDLLALRDNRLPGGVVNYKQLFEEWKLFSAAQTEVTQNEQALRDRLQYALGSEWPTEVLAQFSSADGVILSRAGRGDRISGYFIPGGRNAALIVHAKGADAARRSPEVEKLVQAGYSVLLIDAFQTGAAKASRNRLHRYFLSYNKTDDANRVQDILTALSFLQSMGHTRVQLTGLEGSGVWCLFAAAVAPMEVDLHANLEGFQGTDEDFLQHFFVPGIQRAGGVEAALRLTARERFWCLTKSGEKALCD